MNEWIGGFEESNPDFRYPTPNLNSLPILDNMANICKLQRQMKVLWPEFSWTPTVGSESSRYFQRFATDISRIGYTDRGRVFSIICPQQGAFIKDVLNFNVEVTVTGQRGWVNEQPTDGNYMAAELGVMGRIWFSPDGNHLFFKHLYDLLAEEGLPFSKCNAIDVKTSAIGDPTKFLFTLRQGETNRCKFPPFAQHHNEAYTVGHIDVQINEIIKTGNQKVDLFNQFVMDVFNVISYNMLAKGNVLTWNVWFSQPEVVDQKEWADHAEKWRRSLNVDHSYPQGGESAVFDFNHNPVKHSLFDYIKIGEIVYKFIKDMNLNVDEKLLEDLVTSLKTS